MSRSSTTTNRHDVAVARYNMFSRLAMTLMSVLIAAIAASGTPPSIIDLDNATVVIAPGGRMAVTPVPTSANASALPPSPVHSRWRVRRSAR